MISMHVTGNSVYRWLSFDIFNPEKFNRFMDIFPSEWVQYATAFLSGDWRIYPVNAAQAQVNISPQTCVILL